MSDTRDWNAEVIAEFRANAGEVTAPYDDPPPMLLVHTIGRKSGKEHIVPMRAMVAGESLYIFASAHGSDRHPDWYYNIVANPDIVIEKGTETIPVHATVVTGEERETIFAANPHASQPSPSTSASLPAPSQSSASTAGLPNYDEKRLSRE